MSHTNNQYPAQPEGDPLDTVFIERATAIHEFVQYNIRLQMGPEKYEAYLKEEEVRNLLEDINYDPIDKDLSNTEKANQLLDEFAARAKDGIEVGFTEDEANRRALLDTTLSALENRFTPVQTMYLDALHDVEDNFMPAIKNDLGARFVYINGSNSCVENSYSGYGRFISYWIKEGKVEQTVTKLNYGAPTSREYYERIDVHDPKHDGTVFGAYEVDRTYVKFIAAMADAAEKLGIQQ